MLDIALKQRRNEIIQADMLRELETLSVTWRGDGVEVRTLQMLARIYAETGRYGESFAAARTATRLQPNSDIIAAVSGRRRGAVRATVSQSTKATIFRRSTRWRCSTNIVN